MEEEELPSLEEGGLSVLVGVVLKAGVKDFIFYTSNAEQFLQRASKIRDAHPEFKMGCEIGNNPTWSQYKDLP